MKEQIKLIEKYYKNTIQRLPRAINGDAPRKDLLKICNELDLLKSIIEVLKISKKCNNCNGTGKDGFDRSDPPNYYTCMECNGIGINKS